MNEYKKPLPYEDCLNESINICEYIINAIEDKESPSGAFIVSHMKRVISNINSAWQLMEIPDYEKEHRDANK